MMMNLEILLDVFQTGTTPEKSTPAANDALVISANGGTSTLLVDNEIPVAKAVAAASLQYEVRPKPDTPDRYRHLVTCQSCQHISATGQCQTKIGYKPMPDAKRDCKRHQPLLEVRQPVADTPYTPYELTALLGRYEGQLLNHLLSCTNCRASGHLWCAEGFAIGSAYDALLLCFDNAAIQHEGMIDRLIKARSSQ